MSCNIDILLVGTGAMAIDYHNVLIDLDLCYSVVGRSQKSCDKFFDKTNKKPLQGGLEKYLFSKPLLPDLAIVSVGVLDLKEATINLIQCGVKNILVEKPGGLNDLELNEILDQMNKYQSNVYIGYNRRFYASTERAREIIDLDGGVTSFNFDFTEWATIVEDSNQASDVLENYFFANSTHVVDLSFHLGGWPKQMESFFSESLKWHNRSAIFSGSGISDSNALFSYQANWKSAGRWGLDILTKKHRLIFKPFEKLQIQIINDIDIKYDASIDYRYDEKYKPGLFKQVEHFIEQSQSDVYMKKLCTISQQIHNYRNYYRKIANY